MVVNPWVLDTNNAPKVSKLSKLSLILLQFSEVTNNFSLDIRASQTNALPSREIRSEFPIGFVHLVFTSIVYRDLTSQLKIIATS